MSEINRKRWLLFSVSVCLMAAGWKSGILCVDPETSVELILQNPELPNGCETASLAMLLSSVGLSVDVVTLYTDYVPSEDFVYREGERFGPDPEESYAGDATSEDDGWYCFEDPVVEAGNAWIAQNGGDVQIEAVSGLSQEELDQYAKEEIAVAVWVTMDYELPAYAYSYTWILPNGEEYVPYSNLHCVVLAGEENGKYWIADPIDGWQTVEKEAFWSSFDALGRRAVTVYGDNEALD